MGLLILLLGLFSLDLIYLDAILWMREAMIDREDVANVDVFPFRFLGQYLVLRAGERLERTFQLNVICNTL